MSVFPRQENCKPSLMERGSYRRREPEKTVLYQVVRENLNTFLEYADSRSAEGRSLPAYVRNAFRRYLD